MVLRLHGLRVIMYVADTCSGAGSGGVIPSTTTALQRLKELKSQDSQLNKKIAVSTSRTRRYMPGGVRGSSARPHDATEGLATWPKWAKWRGLMMAEVSR